MAIHPNQWYIATGQASGLSVDQNELVSLFTAPSFLIKRTCCNLKTVMVDYSTCTSMTQQSVLILNKSLTL